MGGVAKEWGRTHGCGAVPSEARGMAVARIQVKLKPTVLDAQGAQVRQALHALGFEGVRDVRMGRYIELELPDGADAEREVKIGRAHV